MAEERKRDYSFEILGAAILLLLLALLCHFHVICPLPSCPEGLISCNNCPGGCCLPDGSCPCPAGSAPCRLYCPETLNCPSGCCNINTCNCVATPQCPPNTIWSESRGCCLFTNGPNSGECATLCSVNQNKVSCPIPGMDACDANKCCPFGSAGWDNNQKCCVDSSGNCMLVCIIDSSRSGCPQPGQGGCEAPGCCPKDSYWDGTCCRLANGYCTDDPCASVECPTGQTCINGKCSTNLCENVNCPIGMECDPTTGSCITPLCDGKVCPEGQVCKDGQCKDPCEGIRCETGQKCVNGECIPDPCANVKCPTGQECRDGSCFDPCQGISCNETSHCEGGKCVDNCQGVTCLSGVCNPYTGKCEENNLVSCTISGNIGNCDSNVLCNDGCANGYICTDRRLPEGQCKQTGESCSSSQDCCCGTSCIQDEAGNGICCPGGLWSCSSG